VLGLRRKASARESRSQFAALSLLGANGGFCYSSLLNNPRFSFSRKGQNG